MGGGGLAARRARASADISFAAVPLGTKGAAELPIGAGAALPAEDLQLPGGHVEGSADLADLEDTAIPDGGLDAVGMNLANLEQVFSACMCRGGPG